MHKIVIGPIRRIFLYSGNFGLIFICIWIYIEYWLSVIQYKHEFYCNALSTNETKRNKRQ